MKFCSKFIISAQENSFQNAVYKMSAILSRPQCVKICICLFQVVMSSPRRCDEQYPLGCDEQHLSSGDEQRISGDEQLISGDDQRISGCEQRNSGCGEQLRSSCYSYSILEAFIAVTIDVPLKIYTRADSRFPPSQLEMSLFCNDVSHWLRVSLESVLYTHHIAKIH